MIWIIIFKWNILLLYWYQYCMCKWLFINYVIFFAPFQTTTSPFVIFWHTPPYPLPDDVIYERENDISMIDFFVRRTLTAYVYFSSWSNFWCLWGEWFDLIATFPWLECFIVVWVLFLFLPLPHHRYLSSFARPPPFCHLLSPFGLPPIPPDWMT